MNHAQTLRAPERAEATATLREQARAEFEPLAAGVLHWRAACEAPGLKGAERDRAWEARNDAERDLVFAVRRYPRAAWVELMALAEALCRPDAMSKAPHAKGQ